MPSNHLTTDYLAVASTLQEKEDMCRKLTVVTKSNTALEQRVENLKRVVAKF